METNWIESDEISIIYIGDTMCSWCYGMVPELIKIKNNHPELKFRLINGGLRPFNTEKAIEMADFLKSHWVEIEHRTGQKFAFDILKDPSFIYDTEPAARAVVAVRKMSPSLEFDFFKAIQTAFYLHNKDTNLIETYLEIAKDFSLDLEQFKQIFESAEIKKATLADFQLSQRMGIRGFPSLVLKKSNEFTLLAHGYQTAENVESILEKIM
jgi:putative protein-disulfide isomerase